MARAKAVPEVWIEVNEAAALMSEIVGREISPDYVRQRGHKGKISMRSKDGRTNEYLKGDVDRYAQRMRSRKSPLQAAGRARLSESKRYELVLQAILQFACTTLGYVEVEDSRDYPGLLSEVPRQIDATISLPDGRRIAVECKQWNRKVDIQHVEAFDAKVRNDLGWDVGTPIMVVTAVDFTPAARNYAGKRNIQLAKLNHAATAEAYTLQLEGHTLIGSVDQLWLASEVMVTRQWNSVDQLYAESSGTFTQTPVEP